MRTYSFIIFIGFIVFNGFQPVGIGRQIRDPMKDLCETRMEKWIIQKKNWNKTPTTTSFLTHFACAHLFNILIAVDVKCTINYLLLNLKCPPSLLRCLFVGPIPRFATCFFACFNKKKHDHIAGATCGTTTSIINLIITLNEHLWERS